MTLAENVFHKNIKRTEESSVRLQLTQQKTDEPLPGNSQTKQTIYEVLRTPR